MASTVDGIGKSVVYRIVTVPIGVAMVAAPYSLWAGASWLRSVLWVITFYALWIPFVRFSQRRREG